MKRIVIILLCALCPFMVYSQSETDKFLGVWHTDSNVMGSMKITMSEDGTGVLVQLKYRDGSVIKSADAVVDKNEIRFSIVSAVEYGSYRVGKWNGSDNHILVDHADNSYGTNGPVTGFYSSSLRKANKKVLMIYYTIKFWAEGTLELWFNAIGNYYQNDVPVFYQSGNWVKMADYTNW